MDLTVNPVDIEFVGLPATTDTNSVSLFTVKVEAGGSPLEGYAVDVWSENGRLTQSTVTTDDNGEAIIGLIAPPNEAQVTVKAMVAMQSPIEATVDVTFPAGAKPSMNNQRAKMVGDATAESAFTYTRWDGNAFNINKTISGSIEVYGAADEDVNVSIGSVFAPNRLTQAAYWMNSAEGAKDEVTTRVDALENVELVQDTYKQAGSSYLFQRSPDYESRVKITNAARMELPDHSAFVIDVKPDSTEGQIFNLGNALTLELLSTGELQLSAHSDDGNTYTATHTSPLALNQWHQVAGSFEGGMLTLTTTSETVQTPVAGQLSFSDITSTG